MFIDMKKTIYHKFHNDFDKQLVKHLLIICPEIFTYLSYPDEGIRYLCRKFGFKQHDKYDKIKLLAMKEENKKDKILSKYFYKDIRFVLNKFLEPDLSGFTNISTSGWRARYFYTPLLIKNGIYKQIAHDVSHLSDYGSDDEYDSDCEIEYNGEYKKINMRNKSNVQIIMD